MAGTFRVMLLRAWIGTFFFLAANAAAQPPQILDAGALHNAALEKLYRDSPEPDSTAIVRQTVHFFMPDFAPAKQARFSASLLSFLSTHDDQTTFRYFAQNHPNTVRYLNAVSAALDTAYLKTPRLLQNIEKEISQDSILLNEEKLALLGGLSVARASYAFWDARENLVFAEFYTTNDSLSDTLRAPCGKIVKADFYGFLKGLIFGAIVWFGSEYAKVKRPTAIILGAAVALVVAPIQSALYARKYRKGKYSKKEMYKDWEIDPRKL